METNSYVIQITQDIHQMQAHQGESNTPYELQSQNKGKGRRKTWGIGVHMNKGKKTNQESSTV